MSLRFRHTLAVTVLAWTTAATAQTPVTIDDLQRDFCFEPVTDLGIQPAPTTAEYYTQLIDYQRIEMNDYATGRKRGTLLDLSEVKECPIEYISAYQLSPLESHILVATQDSAMNRNTVAYNYYIYDIKYKTLTPLCDKGRQMAAAFSPNGEMIAYVRDNDIYLYKIKYSSTSAVTTDGAKGQVVNGMPDWVYEEEFAMNSAWAWSPDSKEIAYLRLDMTNVSTARMVEYKASNPEKKENSHWPSVTEYKYPKVGEKNPVPSVKVFNVDNRTTKTMDMGSNTDIYLPRLMWTGNPKQLAVVRLNRRQNTMDLMVGNSATTVFNALVSERTDTYIDPMCLDGFRFLPDGQNFVMMSEEDGWRHLWLYGLNGVKKKCLTTGDYDVTKLLAFDAQTQTVYYQAAKQNPMQRELYATSLDGKRNACISGIEKGTYKAMFSTDAKHFVCDFSNNTKPNVISICSALGKTLRTLETNKRVVAAAAQHNLLSRKYTTIEMPDGTKLNAWVVYPAGFDPAKQYPTLLTQYNGPDIQMVLDTWEVDWEQVLANEGYMVWCVDTRGTGARGAAFRKAHFRKLGIVESNDMIDVARYIGSLPYADASRIGLWGWSYGGYMTTLCMTRSDLFKMGIAVAAVTDWRYYDSVYAERYMRSPEENSSGYDAASPLLNAANLSGRLLLVHGASDDNVHLQNMMEMTDALVQAGKQFDMFVYPNRNHSIYGGNVRPHLYQMFVDYVKRNL